VVSGLGKITQKSVIFIKDQCFGVQTHVDGVLMVWQKIGVDEF
jgi:hypothetical protein